MSEELSIETNNFISKKLVEMQNSMTPNAWCHREPKKWLLVAQQIIQQPTEHSEFMRKHKITRNFFYDVRTELFSDPECKSIRNNWANEISSVMFQGLDTYRKSQDSYSDRIERGDIEIDGNELFKQGKSLQAFSDIHAKLTGNNVQTIIVKKPTTLDEAAEYARKMIDDIPEAEIVD
jgi:hypothetical protein